MRKGREPRRIDGMIRRVHHVAAKIIDGKELVGFFNEDQQVYQHDITKTDDGRIFWRGALLRA